jgi:hypothetical protein
MPMELSNDQGSTVVLDAEVPTESISKSKAKHEKVHSSLMSADDTDLDTASKGISLTHKNKLVKVSPKADNKMVKKDKASESIKKEFKHQMDLTKNIG